MAQSITNTVSTNPIQKLFGGLVAPPLKQGYLGGGSTPSFGFNAPAQSTQGLVTSSPNMSRMPAADLAAAQSRNQSVAPAQTQNSGLIAPPQQQTVASTAPIVRGANSGGTINPNFNAQGIQGGPTGTPVRGLFPDIVSSLAAKGAGPSSQYTQAYGDASKYNSQLQSSLSNEASALKTNYLNPIPIGDQEGRAAVIRNQYLAQQQALGSGFQGASNLISGANTQQANQTTALNNAGNLAQPSPTSYGQTSFDPTTNTFGGGSNGGLPPDVMQQYATMAANGNYTAIPSFITSNPVLNAQLNVAAKALNPNFSPVQAQGASQVLGGIPALTSANTAAEGIKNTINSYLQANHSLNPSDLAAGNILNQWIQGKQLTDPKYQTLFNYLNEYTNTLAPILGVGGEPTNLKTQIAAGFINAAASGQSITQVLDAMSMLATHKIQDLQSGAVGGGTTVPNTTGAGGGTGGFAETW